MYISWIYQVDFLNLKHNSSMLTIWLYITIAISFILPHEIDILLVGMDCWLLALSFFFNTKSFKFVSFEQTTHHNIYKQNNPCFLYGNDDLHLVIVENIAMEEITAQHIQSSQAELPYEIW